MKAQILSKEYRIAKQELGAPSSLTLTPGRVVALAEERVGALVTGLAELSSVAGLDDLYEMSHTDLAASLERDGIQSHSRREPSPYP